MKKNYILVLIAIFATIGIFVACHENIIDRTVYQPSDNKLVKVEGRLNLPSDVGLLYSNCYIQSIVSESENINGRFEVETFFNDKVQTFIVQENDEVYLMNRTPIIIDQPVELSIQSTAIAMVTMHPLFSPVGKEDYETLIALITENSKFHSFYEEVEKAVLSKRHLYDESNEGMLIAFSNLMEDLCGETENEDDYDGNLSEIQDTTTRSINTRAVDLQMQINPTYIDAEINGKTLSLRTVWVTPSYYGTVSQPNGQVVNKVIASRDDYGIMDLVNKRTTRGEPMEHTFFDEGEYRFNFSRVNAEATLDFYMRIAGSILSTFGLSIDGSDEAVVEAAKYISNAITAAGSGVSDGNMSALDWLGIAYDATLNQISTTGRLGRHTFSQTFINASRVLASSFNWYNKIKGAANIGLRLAYAFDAPEIINFCLCYYDNEVTTCTEASLYKVDGDEQIGYANQKLLLPLTVYVQTIGDDGMYYESSSYHRVKFEVVSGGGEVDFDLVSADNNNKAYTYWTLGESGEQKVKVTVVDIITDKEISEPVYFTASLESASVTIRLNWSKHSCNTDIDLHVVDPYGEEIYYRHMESASGGYLDRDDVVGPGPEHVRWTNAPAGTYKIYVHYFPNEAEDRSITSYKVTVNTSEREYRPATGSIAYNQMIGVGQFTIGEQQTRSTISTELMATDEVIENKVYPKK